LKSGELFFKETVMNQNRAVTSWNSQPLPSGSLNEANER